MLSSDEMKKASKLELSKIAHLMNNCGPGSAVQHAGRKVARVQEGSKSEEESGVVRKSFSSLSKIVLVKLLTRVQHSAWHAPVAAEVGIMLGVQEQQV